VEKSFQVGSQTLFTGSARVNIVPGGTSTGIGHIGFLFAEKVGFHGFVHSTQGWGMALELNHLEVNDSWLDVSFAYKAPSPFNHRPPYSSYEINMGYYFLRNQE
jgi:hypothetical protein